MISQDKKKEETIRELYLSSLSISEIGSRLSLSPSGVMYQLKKQGVPMRSRSEANRIKHNKMLDSFSAILPEDIPKTSLGLYLIALALYWGEGAKTSNTVAITNSDPEVIRTFLLFLRKICHIDDRRLRVLIHYHQNQNENELILYWSSLLVINPSQFYKSTLHKKSTKKSTNYLKFGTISLRYSDSLLHKEILARIKVLKKYF